MEPVQQTEAGSRSREASAFAQTCQTATSDDGGPVDNFHRGRRRSAITFALDSLQSTDVIDSSIVATASTYPLAEAEMRADVDSEQDGTEVAHHTTRPKAPSIIYENRLQNGMARASEADLSPSSSLPTHRDDKATGPTGLLATLKHRALHTGPGWFGANMGFGIASILLYNMPYSFTGLQEIGLAFFVANCLLFFFLLSLTIARYVMWPRLLRVMLYHPTQAFFLGTLTMGAVTLVEVVIMALIPRLGQAWLYVGWISWWIIAAATIVVAIGVPFLTQTRQQQSFDQITGVWFLPVVAPVVCASAGSIVANAMVDAGLLAASQAGDPLSSAAVFWFSHARIQEIACYILLGIGLVPSLLWMPVYSSRLALHKLPTPVIVSCFIPVGCCGQGAYALLHISRTLRRITVITGVPPLGGVDDTFGNVISPASALSMADAVYALSQVGALILWGLGIVWLSFAVMSVLDVLSVSDIALNLGLWASTFPVGTMAASAGLLGAELNSTPLKIVSTVLSVIVVLDVTWIAVVTLVKGWTGELFHAQDLADIGGEVPTSLPPSRKYTFQPRSRSRKRTDNEGFPSPLPALADDIETSKNVHGNKSSSPKGGDLGMKLLVCITLALSTAASSTALYAGNGSNLCQLFEHAGLINLDVLGCGRVLSRAPRHGDSKEKACSALRTAGLSNLDLIGCTIKDEQIVPPSARGWDGEDRHHMPPEQPEGSHPALKEPCDEPVHPPHSKQPSFPKYTPSDPPTTHTPPSTKQPPAKHLPVEGPGPVLKGPSDKPVQPPCSTKELCKVMQEGLIN
ncbi:unnamed protein product, partial [Tilletia controversa]